MSATEQFCTKVRDERALPFRASVSFPSMGGLMGILREVYVAVTGGKVELPKSTSFDDSVSSARGDGLLSLKESRGFMVGMGETLTYLMLADENVSIEVEDFWEDNIAGPETAVFKLRARSAEQLKYAVSSLKFAVNQKGWGWKDEYPAPKRADRAKVEAAVRGLTDPAAAWAKLAVPDRGWTFLQEQFEICGSCSGSGWDTYSGVCYGCLYNGRNLSGWKPFPHPATMNDVIAFGAELEVMLRIDVSARTLVERLLPWGMPALSRLEWLVQETNHQSGSGFDRIPRCMVPVFTALSKDLNEPTLEPGLDTGWLAQGSRAWKDCSFSFRPDPFEPIREIRAAGYRVDFTTEAVRLSCD